MLDFISIILSLNSLWIDQEPEFFAPEADFDARSPSSAMAALLKPRLKLSRRAPLVAGLAAVLSFAPERMASRCGTSADAVCRLTRELAHAPRTDIYGRMGTSVPAYGTLCAWLSDVQNILAGNLNRAGGVMFPKAAAISANTSDQWKRPRHRNRTLGKPRADGRAATRSAVGQCGVVGGGSDAERGLKIKQREANEGQAKCKAAEPVETIDIHPSLAPL